MPAAASGAESDARTPVVAKGIGPASRNAVQPGSHFASGASGVSRSSQTTEVSESVVVTEKSEAELGTRTADPAGRRQTEKEPGSQASVRQRWASSSVSRAPDVRARGGGTRRGPSGRCAAGSSNASGRAPARGPPTGRAGKKGFRATGCRPLFASAPARGSSGAEGRDPAGPPGKPKC